MEKKLRESFKINLNGNVAVTSTLVGSFAVKILFLVQEVLISVRYSEVNKEINISYTYKYTCNATGQSV